MTDTIAPPSGSQSLLREANRARILDVVRRYGVITQVELADATGLSPGTVSVIVKELMEAGVVNVAPTSRSGRRANNVMLARRLGLIGGVHIGQRDLRVALSNPAGEVLERRHLPLAVGHRADTTLDRICMFIADMLDHLGASHDEILAVGVGVDAPIDWATSKVSLPGLMRGWDDVAIGDSLSRRLDAPVLVDNAVNMRALAEYRFGAGAGANPLIYVAVTHGIGAGIIIGGQIFRGFSGAAGEMGHISIDEHGPVCRCGNRGCLEAIAGVPALLESLRAARGTLSLSDLVELTSGGDVACGRVVEDAARHIGFVLAGLCNIVDPQRIIVGGEIASVGELFLAPLRRATSRFTLPSSTPTIEIVPGQLGNDCAVLGALSFALDSVHLPGNLEGVILHDAN